MMETFNFPVHTPQVRWPEGQSMKFGKGYSYGTKPLLPVMKTHILNFTSMRWYLDESGMPEATTDPTNNMKALMNFYDAHGTWDRFIYPSKIFGNVICKFARPLETPKTTDGGSGWTEPFTIELIENRA